MGELSLVEVVVQAMSGSAGDNGVVQTGGGRRARCYAFPKKPKTKAFDAVIIGILSVYHRSTSVLFTFDLAILISISLLTLYLDLICCVIVC